jgi:hypothetical protein
MVGFRINPLTVHRIMGTRLSLRRADMQMPLAHSGLSRLLLAGIVGFFLNPQHLLADGFFVSGVSPTSGPTAGGTLVTITGHEFTGASAVNFGSIPAASFAVINDTTITATSPAEAAGTVDISVTVSDPTTPILPADEFTYIQTTPTPALNQWSMLALAILLAGVGYLGLTKSSLRRREL